LVEPVIYPFKARKARIHIPGGVYHVLDDIVATFCQKYGLDKADLINTSQSRLLAERAVVGLLAKTLESATLAEIGASFNRDAGTMSFALRRLVQRVAGDPVLRGGNGKAADGAKGETWQLGSLTRMALV
jgi:hypothetical protein